VLEFKANDDDVSKGVTVDGTPVVKDTVYKYALSWQDFVASQVMPAARSKAPDDRKALAQLDDAARSAAGRVTFTADAGDAAAGVGVSGEEVKASVFQALNPMFILAFGPVFSWLWGALGRRDPSAGVKFGLGLVQLGLGFACFWMGARSADSNGMVAMSWLVLGYLLQTTGELCLSPVGLSLVTKLSPVRVVSTIMGAWFLATAFSHLLAAFLAKLTGVKESGGVIPPPSQTVGTYGEVFGLIAILAIAAGFILFLLSPMLRKLMALDDEGAAARSGH
jgi:POT family proton-dependent oligopeptide transporter